jgi:precorrin-3B synthase
VWAAADGGLARVRVPGGRLAVADLRLLADVADELGSGILELTSRANVQVRGLRLAGEHALADRLRAGGLMPSETHDRVRNIVASPLTGLLPGAGPDVTGLVDALDDALCAASGLAALPGRFLFAIDDGAGDVATLDADVLLVAAGPILRLDLGGVRVGTVADFAAIPAALAAASAFLIERGVQRSPAWRLAELDDGPARVAARLDDSLLHERALEIGPESAPTSTPGSCMSNRPHQAGEYRQADGRVALVLDAGDGRLSAGAFRALADRADPVAGVRVTPWRGVVLPNLAPDAVGTVTAALAGHGLAGVDPERQV